MLELFFSRRGTQGVMSREFRLASWMVPLFNHYLFSFLRGNYRTIGAYTAMSIVHGGPGLPIFPEAVLNYLTITGVKIEINSLPLHLKFLFEQVILLLHICSDVITEY